MPTPATALHCLREHKYASIQMRKTQSNLGPAGRTQSVQPAGNKYHTYNVPFKSKYEIFGIQYWITWCEVQQEGRVTSFNTNKKQNGWVTLEGWNLKYIPWNRKI